MRVLPIAIGTLSAIAVQELGLTRHTSTNNDVNEVHESKPAESDDIEIGQLSEPIAAPERLPVPGVTQIDTSNQLPGLKSLNLNSQQKVALSRPYPVVQPLKLDILPLDQVINNTLPSRSTPPVGLEKFLTSKTASAKPTTSAKPLTDIQGHWAQPFVEVLVARDVVKGFSDGTFRPDRPISSAEFSMMARKALPQQLLTIADLQKSYADRLATRADAAAFIYQTMAQAKQVPEIAATETLVASADGKQAPTKVAKPKLTEKSNTVAVNPTTGRSLGIAPPATLPVPLPPPQTIDTLQTVNTSQPIASPKQNQAIVAQMPLSTPLPPNTLIPINAPTVTAAALPTGQEYVLGAGDSIRLDVFDVPEYSKEYKVLVNGTLNLPLLGSITVGGLTLQQAGNLLSAKYAPYLTRPRVTITLLAPRPLNIAVAGEVNRPGSYTVSLAEDGKLPTLTRVVQMAGGMTQGADLRQVEVRRPQRSGNDEIIQVDLMQLLRSGDLRQDLVLRDGDTVMVPSAKAVDLAESSQLAASNFGTDLTQPINIAIVGEVNRPGPHTLAKADKTADRAGGMPTVTKAIQQAGGITQLADLRRVEVYRAARSSGTEQIINVNLWDLLQNGDLKQDLILQQGDRVVIPTAKAISPAEATRLAAASFSPDTIKVNVVGEVVQPGTVEVSPNTPLNQALLNAGGFNNRAKKKAVQLIRLNPNGTVTQQSITVDLASGISEQTNPMLRNNDIVVVGRSGGAKLSDTLNDVLTPLGRLLPLLFLF